MTHFGPRNEHLTAQIVLSFTRQLCEGCPICLNHKCEIMVCCSLSGFTGQVFIAIHRSVYSSLLAYAHVPHVNSYRWYCTCQSAHGFIEGSRQSGVCATQFNYLQPGHPTRKIASKRSTINHIT